MADVVAGISEKLFNGLLARAVSALPPIPLEKPTEGDVVWFGCTAKFRVVDCNGVDFEDGNTFWVSELDLTWDQLRLEIGLDIPSFEIGGFCVLPIPDFLGGGCVRMKRYTMFPGVPDVGPVSFDLGPILSNIVTEISGRFTIDVRSAPGKRSINLLGGAVDVDLIDVEGTAAQMGLLKGALMGLIAQRISDLIPGTWLMDLALKRLGVPTPAMLALDLLDIGDDFEEWLTKALNASLGSSNLLASLILKAMNGVEVTSIDDPYPVEPETTLDASDYGGFAAPPPALVPIPKIGIPLKSLKAEFSEDLMVVSIDFDAP